MRYRDRICFGLLVAALVASVLGIGGALRSVQAVVAFLVVGALGVQLFARRRLDETSPLISLLAIPIALCALQLLPLPAAVREALDPTGEALRASGAELAGTSPWPCLSHDPAGTLRALAFFAILFGVATLALRFAASERGRYALLASVAGTCGLAALVTGIHVLVNAHSLYGVYAPSHATPHILGPLLNGNHLGGLMAIGAVISVALTFYERQRVQLRVVWIFTAAGCLLVGFTTLSRGAVLNFGCGAAVVGAAMIAQRIEAGPSRRRRRGRVANYLPVTITVLCAVGLAVYSSAGKVADQLDNTTLTELSQPSSKYAAWKTSLQLVHESPWLGVGRGAFEPTFTRVHDPAAFVTFSHLENEYLQALVDWGLPGALLLLFVALWCCRTAFSHWRDGPLAAAALGAIAGIMLQSMVDFGIELLGIAVPMTIVAATVMRVRLREAGEARRDRALRAAMIAGIAIAGVVLLSSWTTSVQEDHDALAAETPPPGLIHAAIERHPFDYFSFGQAAVEAMHRNDPHAVTYLNHAMILHPTYPGLHRLAAQLLVASGRRSQAAIQYALAFRGAVSPSKLVTEILATLPDLDDSAAALPLDGDIDPIYRALDTSGHRDVLVRWLARVASQPQRDTFNLDRLYKLAMLLKDYERAEKAAKLRLRAAHTNTSRVMLARVHAKQGESELVLSELSDVANWHGMIVDKFEAWLLVCDVRIAQRDWDKANECLHHLDGSNAVVPGRREELNQRTAYITDQRMQEAHARALEALQQQQKSP
jgi:O-antigen ligase